MTENTNESINVAGLYQDSYNGLYSYILRKLSNPSDAHDLAQEAFLRLLRVEKKELIQSPKAYLFRIALNLIYEFRIKQNKNVLKDASLLEDTTLPTSDRSVEDSQIHRETLEALNTILGELPPLYAAVLYMRKRDGLSQAEVAEKLNISIHTVRKYLTRALAACQKYNNRDIGL